MIAIEIGYLWNKFIKCQIPEDFRKVLQKEMYLDFEIVLPNINLPARVCKDPNEKNYYISNCALYRNDENIMKQWIEWQMLMGIEHFYLYDHQSFDKTNEILEPYIKRGIVTYHNWRNYRPEPHTIKTYHLAQDASILSCLNRYRENNKWLWFGDDDEFLYPLKEDSIIPMLKLYEKDIYAGLKIKGYRWQDDPKHPIPLVPDRTTQTALLEERPLNMTFPEKYQFRSTKWFTYKVFVRPIDVEQTGLHDMNGIARSNEIDEGEMMFNHYRLERYGRVEEEMVFDPKPYQRFQHKIHL